MIRYISLFISIILISFTSCVNTDVYSSEFTMRSDLSVEEKLEGFGAKKIYVDEPETYFAGELWLEKLIELTKYFFSLKKCMSHSVTNNKNFRKILKFL